MTQWGLDTLFNPAKRHMDEEKRRLQSTREEVGDNSGGKRVDFESGKVTIRRQDSAGDPAGPADDTAGDDEPADAEATGSPKSAAKSAKAAKSARPATAPSPAAIRAAKRRGREPR